MAVSALFDPTGRWSLAQAEQRFASGTSPETGAVEGWRTCLYGTWWLRIKISGTSQAGRSLRVALVSTRIERARFYIRQGGRLEQGVAGASLPMSKWTWPGRLPSMPVHLQAGEEAVVYVAARTCLQAAYTAMVMQEDLFIAREQRSALRAGILGGGLFALALAVGVFSVQLRNRRLAMLALLAIVGGLYELASRGYGLWVLWPGWGEWNVRSPHALGSTLALLLGLFCWSVGRGDRFFGAISFPRGSMPTTLIFSAQAGGVATAFLAPPDVALRIALPLSLVLYAYLSLCCATVIRAGGAKAAIPIAVTVMFSLINIALRAAELGWPVRLSPEASVWFASGLWITLASMLTYLAILGFWVRHAVIERREVDARIAALQQAEKRDLEQRVQERTGELNHALQLTEKKNEELHGLLGYIGHDLRAPLATISGYVDRLKSKASLDCGQDLRVISQNLDYQLSLIDDLVHHSRADQRPLAVRPIWIALAPFLAELESVAVSLCSLNGNRYRLRLRDAPRYLKTDPKRLRQVLTNLLSNAAKFTHFGDVELAVASRRANPGQGSRLVIFSVRDTGTGMAGEDVKKIFQPYTTLNTAGSGSGLGLFITTKIAQEMGASVVVKSALRKGTRIALLATQDAAGCWCAQFQPLSLSPVTRADHPRPPATLTAGKLGELVQLAQMCRYSDLLDWVEEQARSLPEDAFVAWVRAAAEALDFNAIMRAARSHLGHASPRLRKLAD